MQPSHSCNKQEMKRMSNTPHEAGTEPWFHFNSSLWEVFSLQYDSGRVKTAQFSVEVLF